MGGGGPLNWRYFRFERTGTTALVTLDRPPVNAIDLSTIGELNHVLDRLYAADDLRAVIFAAAPGKVFAAGADIHAMPGMTPEEGVAMNRQFQETFLRLERLPCPTVCALHGAVLGGGFELAMACDLRIAAEETRFTLPEPRLGLIPGAGGTQRLGRLIAIGKAKELLFLGGWMSAAEALQCGLVQRVVPEAALIPTALEFGERIARNAPVAIRAIKEAVNASRDLPIEAGLDLERERAAECFKTADFREGVDAFLTKREPHFRGQ